jgi:hypothetical protein
MQLATLLGLSSLAAALPSSHTAPAGQLTARTSASADAKDLGVWVMQDGVNATCSGTTCTVTFWLNTTASPPPSLSGSASPSHLAVDARQLECFPSEDWDAFEQCQEEAECEMFGECGDDDDGEDGEDDEDEDSWYSESPNAREQQRRHSRMARRAAAERRLESRDQYAELPNNHVTLCTFDVVCPTGNISSVHDFQELSCGAGSPFLVNGGHTNAGLNLVVYSNTLNKGGFFGYNYNEFNEGLSTNTTVFHYPFTFGSTNASGYKN